MSEQQAGWYADPSGDISKLRYWDGSQWTNDFCDNPTQTPNVDAAYGEQTVYATPAKQPDKQVTDQAVCAAAGSATTSGTAAGGTATSDAATGSAATSGQPIAQPVYSSQAQWLQANIPPQPYYGQYGQTPSQMQVQPGVYPPQPTNGTAVASLILSIVGACTGFITFGILSIIAIILGAVGMRRPYDKGIAIAGLALGIIFLILWAIFWAIVLTTPDTEFASYRGYRYYNYY